MSPVHSKPAPHARRQPAQQTALFPALSPESRERGSRVWTGPDLAPIVTGPGGSISSYTTPDCPPASSADHGPQCHEQSRARDAAALCGGQAAGSWTEAPARLVGIARLAANSPAAETQRNSAER